MAIIKNKVLGVLLGLAIVFCLTACGGGGDAGSSSSSSSSSSSPAVLSWDNGQWDQSNWN